MPRRAAIAPSAKQALLPAPRGGWNAVAGAMEMPVSDCILVYNMIAAEYGYRPRLGSREWVSGLYGHVDSYVRSLLPFAGAASNGANDRLFAATSEGIFNVTDSLDTDPIWEATTAYVVGSHVRNDTGKTYVCDTAGTSAGSGGPTGTGANIVDGTARWDYVRTDLFLTFASSSGRAGHGMCHAHVTSAGHHLLYADEVNGLHVYADSSASIAADTWQAIVSATQTAWAALTAYSVGNLRTNDSGKVYICTTAGTSAGAGGPTGTTSGIADGSVVWAYNNSISGVDPTKFVAITVFKGRVWAIEANTANLWYSDVGAIYGAYTKFALSTKLAAGGALRSLWNWTYDGGGNLDDSLVVASDGGDIVIYQGTDPSSADTFGLVGTWQVGALPKGREIAVDMGGDLWILTRRGLVPMSKLVAGQDVATQYPTYKISPLINAELLTKAGTEGWAMRIHPQESALILTVPVAEGSASTQWAMSLYNGSWSKYRDLPTYCLGVFGGQMYFGTVLGSVCINDGYVDGRPLATPTESTPVQYSLISAFQNLGSANHKQVTLIRPRLLGQSQAPSYQAEARYDFNLTELAPVSLAPGAGSLWDTAIWDTAVWAGDYSATSSIRGASGIGVHVAIAFRGAATDRVILAGFEVSYIEGGPL